MVYWHAISTTKKVQLETVANLILETVIVCSNIYIYTHIIIYIYIYMYIPNMQNYIQGKRSVW